MLTQQQFSTLTNTLTGAVYVSLASSGDYNGILGLINASYNTANSYIDRVYLKDILSTQGIYQQLLLTSNSPGASGYALALSIVHTLDDPDYPQFRLQNPAIQAMLAEAVGAGIMTAAQVAELEAQFTPATSTIANDILGRLATLDDINQVLGTPLIGQLNNVMAYAQTKAQSVLTPLQDAVSQKQSQISAYMGQLQTILSTLQAGNPDTVPSTSDVDTAIG